jgi:hypothetical protein
VFARIGGSTLNVSLCGSGHVELQKNGKPSLQSARHL